MRADRLFLPLLCAASVFGGRIESLEVVNHVSRDRVRRLVRDGDSVLVDTTGGLYRLELEFGADLSSGLAHRVRPPRSGDEALSAGAAPGAAIRAGECEYEPGEEGLAVRCPSGISMIRLGGYPATSAAEHDGRVYVGTYGGGLRSADSPSSRVPDIPAAVTALTAAGGRLVCGTEAGLFVFDGKRVFGLNLGGPVDNNVSRLARGGGALWVGTFDRGVSRLRGGVWRHWTVRDGLPSDWIDDLEWDGSRLWGAGDRGVFWIEGDRVIVPEDPRLRRKTSALCGDGRAVLLAQRGAIVRWEPGGGRISVLATHEDHPQDILAGKEGIWLAGLTGLRLLSRDGVSGRRYEALDGALPGDWVTALARGKEGLLIGTYDRGFAALDAGRGRHRMLLPGAWVNLGAIAARRGVVAVGGMDEGLHFYNEGRWRRITREQGLAGDDVTSVLFDRGFLWVGTRSGVSRVRL